MSESPAPDLFLTSYLPTTSFPATSLISSLSHLSDSNNAVSKPKKHDNFVRLLQHAIVNQTPILPLTWEPGFERLGLEGVVGTVNQNLLNSKISLAFKRFKEHSSDPRVSHSEFRDHQYDAVMSELTVFGCRPVLLHHNIIEFVGLSFEISPIQDEVKPVLVFTKSNKGDLATFKDSVNDLEEDTMIAICGEIAKGIYVLHCNNIVHGDIKPSNILAAMSPEQDAMSITLADFGFSRVAPTTDSYVNLTRSEPWEAPEWTHVDISLSDAKAMDIYSFGLLCLWWVFGDCTLGRWGLESSSVHSAFSRQDTEAFEELQYRKRNSNNMLELAEELVDRHKTLKPETKSCLRKLFTLSLEYDYGKRLRDVHVLENLLCDDSAPGLGSQSDSASTQYVDWHGSFKIEHLFFSLESCDYRVHNYVTKALANMAAGEGCDVCRKNAAAQLIVCRVIGFGIEHSDQKDTEYRDCCGLSFNQEHENLQRFKRDNKLTDSIMAQLSEHGYRHDFCGTYQRDGVLKDAMDYYRRAITKRKALFSADHYSVLRLQGLLLNLTRQQNQLDEAMEIALEMQEASQTLKIADQLEIKTEIAQIYADKGDLQKAADLGREVLEIRNSISGLTNTTEMLDSERELAKTLAKQGQFDAAIPLAEKNLRACLEQLGDLHPSTIAVRRCLARALSASGQLDLAMEANISLLEAEEQLMTRNYVDPKFVEDISILGVQCYRMNDIKRAKECYEKAHRLIEKDQTKATHAIIAVNNCVVELIRQGDYMTALVVAEALLPEATKLVGADCEDAALVMGNLALLYSNKRLHHQAEDLERQVVNIRQRTLGTSHTHTITALENLRYSLRAQGKYEDAESLGHENPDIHQAI